jgi:hypothetical protein
MTFTMAYPNFEKGLKMASGPLGIKELVEVAYRTSSSLCGYSLLFNLS